MLEREPKNTSTSLISGIASLNANVINGKAKHKSLLPIGLILYSFHLKVKNQAHLTNQIV